MQGPSAPLRGALLGLLLERPGHGGELANRLIARLGETLADRPRRCLPAAEAARRRRGCASSREEPRRGNERGTHVVYHPTEQTRAGASVLDGDAAAARAGAAGPAGEARGRARAGRPARCCARCGSTSASAWCWRSWCCRASGEPRSWRGAAHGLHARLGVRDLAGRDRLGGSHAPADRRVCRPQPLAPSTSLRPVPRPSPPPRRCCRLRTSASATRTAAGSSWCSTRCPSSSRRARPPACTARAGSGKSTLLRLAAAIESPDAGSDPLRRAGHHAADRIRARAGCCAARWRCCRGRLAPEPGGDRARARGDVDRLGRAHAARRPSAGRSPRSTPSGVSAARRRGEHRLAVGRAAGAGDAGARAGARTARCCWSTSRRRCRASTITSASARPCAESPASAGIALLMASEDMATLGGMGALMSISAGELCCGEEQGTVVRTAPGARRRVRGSA